MAEIGRRYKPKEKKPKNTGKKKMDKILNVLIGVVVVLILIVAGFIVIGGSDSKDTANDKVAKTVEQDNDKQDEKIVEKNNSKELEKEKAKQAEESQKKDEQDQTQTEDTNDVNSAAENTSEENNSNLATDEESNSTATNSNSSSYNYEESETATTETSGDANVLKVVTDSNWKPTKTSQKDKGSSHVSSYTKGSVDWNEKITTIANTAGLDEKDMIVWYVKNGGSPDTSVGIVSSKDKEKSYRVSLKWVPEEGWKPTKLEVLKTYKGAY
ncbi:YrrS family protein [Rummeliibacillus sp. POC4]|uniref:YrrS family protein n=1 Tax=Rummeliibacillus sp. POC4 TaxID=2305899 RepID=UPI000E669114|nr:YrrS family protein [Rummeliibacillus sp. POC4]RIJ67533.1 DUF1510 family protein [Rummeliibacillus sp. POC4]